MSAREIAQQLKARFGEIISEPTEFRAEITVQLSDAGRIAEICQFAKKELGFDFLLDITSIDNYGSDPRWTLVYHLYGYGHHCRLRIKTGVSEEKSELPTVTGVWRTADWHEREIYDMMGIRFQGHPDLRRILMWEGYPYFPLRKDFPLAGRPTELPEVAFTRTAPQEGGPFVTRPGGRDSTVREPRAHELEADDPADRGRAERI
ncbi:MAG: NADH-quinone oxidoreductase subunit C [Limisphaerales bacterium]